LLAEIQNILNKQTQAVSQSMLIMKNLESKVVMMADRQDKFEDLVVKIIKNEPIEVVEK